MLDRPERTFGARGGGGSAPASSRAPLWSGRDHGHTRRGASARDRFAGAQAHSRLSAAHWAGAGGGIARPIGGGPRCHGVGALCLVGGAVWPAAACSDAVAGDPPPRRDAEKKALAASERNAEARQAWRAAVAQRAPEQLVCVAASGTHSSLTRRYGWAPQDQRATGSVPRTHGKNTTRVAARAPDGLHEPWLIAGARDTESFEWYIREQLAPTLRPGQVVVLENLRVHKAARMRHALEARHCQLLFLPPYSPDFTPIAQAFSKLKAILRGLAARTKEALWEAMRVAVEAITRDDALAWFAHAGYALPAPAT
jgi:transposase